MHPRFTHVITRFVLMIFQDGGAYLPGGETKCDPVKVLVNTGGA